MFAKAIIGSDAFLDMPLSAQALYFHLSMYADDDGFINNPKMIQRMIGAEENDLKLLVTKGYIIQFESGIIVVVHWNIHNALRKDRHKETIYKNERALLEIGKNKEYTIGLPNDNQMATDCLPNGTSDKDSIDNDNISASADTTETIVRLGSGNNPAATPKINGNKKTEVTKHKYGDYKNVLLSDDQLQKLKAEFPHDWEDRINRLSYYMQSSGKSYKDHLATIRNWARKDKINKNGEQQQNDEREREQRSHYLDI